MTIPKPQMRTKRTKKPGGTGLQGNIQIIPKWCKGIWLEHKIFLSKAWKSLKTPSAAQMLILFMAKRSRVPKDGKPRGAKHKEYVTVNNGQIEFTFKKAEVYGITIGQFNRGISELVRVGFIDITQTGTGLHKSTNLYALSERWKLYGTDDFKHVERPKGKMYPFGFKKGNKHGRNCKK